MNEPTLPNQSDRYDRNAGRVRQAVLLALGVGIGIHETVFTSSPQPVLLIFAAGLLGLPLALGLDRKLQQ
jgi:hypothetical protein